MHTLIPSRLKVPVNKELSFDLRHEQVPYFTNLWHFHPEIEINFIIAGTGTRFIGQSVEQFNDGEIVLLGSNLPHYWRNSNAYYEGGNENEAEAIILRFSPQFLGTTFFSLPELSKIGVLFEKAGQGLKLTGALREEVAARLVQLTALDDFQKLMSILHLLQLIAVSNEVETISPTFISHKQIARQNERLGNVIEYLMRNFTLEVSLEKIAEIANMNAAAFCRYFKGQTGQTVMKFVTSLRINYACELLRNGSESISQICYEVGFENVSHFIQAFKKYRKQTPLEYRNGA